MTVRREMRWRSPNGVASEAVARQHTHGMLKMIDRHGSFLARDLAANVWIYGYVDGDGPVSLAIPRDSLSNRMLIQEEVKDPRLVEWHKLNMYRNSSYGDMVVKYVAHDKWYGVGLTWEEAEEQLGKAVLLSLGIDEETT